MDNTIVSRVSHVSALISKLPGNKLLSTFEKLCSIEGLEPFYSMNDKKEKKRTMFFNVNKKSILKARCPNTVIGEIASVVT